MTTLDERLRAQNEGQSWRDCNAAGLPHRWTPEPVTHWFRCVRCPVLSRSGAGAPARFLRGGGEQ